MVWADVIVLQFPVFWYSMPSLLARWMEQTFEHGFSHGAKGKALVGKKLLLSFTVGAPEDMYREVVSVGTSMIPFLENDDDSFYSDGSFVQFGL